MRMRETVSVGFLRAAPFVFVSAALPEPVPQRKAAKVAMSDMVPFLNGC
jgi:hypothetical protein